MGNEIVFATTQDEVELQELFAGYGMGLAGDIEEHVLVKSDNKILAGAMLAQIDSKLFHLLVFAVQEDGCKQGVGSQLLQELLSRPEQYCRVLLDSVADSYQVTTVAKGEAVPFYEKNGFSSCDFLELAYPYDSQCEECPDKTECRPVAMMTACRNN
ncbi:MAG: hypothetical protein H6Q72_4066 [Firmicutes bacterium]|nr:hypothetical protein [Bacillota bacterium]